MVTANYVRNLTPLRGLKGKVPEEAYCGHKPSVDLLRVFGSRASVLNSDRHKKKLDARAWHGIFVGYAMGKRGYRIWDPQSRRVEISRDVVFDEDSF